LACRFEALPHRARPPARLVYKLKYFVGSIDFQNAGRAVAAGEQRRVPTIQLLLNVIDDRTCDHTG